ncbi:hypothetical protein LCH21_03300 [Patescibacteria group bacterium]|nr:hypothetical protein [Patescibacteria group bacterium]
MAWQIGVRGIFVALIVATASITPVLAETLQSTNFKFDETSVGTSGLINSGSANYGITEATGDLGVGNSTSTNYQINAGSKTTGDPALSFVVNSSGTNFGAFTPTATSTTTASFTVLNYTTYGYVVQIVGTPPQNGAHTITPMSVLGPAQAGVEQFGINLVANTLPISLGTNPDNGQFGFGALAANYNTPNKYFYQSGDIIAQSDKDSGVTNYTISYVVNVSPLTHGGQYTTNQTLVVTGTY